MLICHYIVTSIDMKLNPFNKNKKNKDMNPKEKEAEKELNSQETENIAEEQLQVQTGSCLFLPSYLLHHRYL